MNETLNKIKTQLKELINEKTSKEELERFTAISSTIDEVEKEFNTIETEHNQLKTDYINLIKDTSFKTKELPDTKQPRGLEEIAQDLLNKK